MIDWKNCANVVLQTADGKEIEMEDLVGKNQDRFQLSHLSITFRVITTK